MSSGGSPRSAIASGRSGSSRSRRRTAAAPIPPDPPATIATSLIAAHSRGRRHDRCRHALTARTAVRDGGAFIPRAKGSYRGKRLPIPASTRRPRVWKRSRSCRSTSGASTCCSSPSARWSGSTRSARSRGSAPRRSRGSSCSRSSSSSRTRIVMAELGTTFAQEGGPVRVDEARVGPRVGRRRLGALLGHEPALGRRLARVPLDRRVEPVHPQGRHRARVGDYAFKLVFIWISIIVAIVSLQARQVDPERRARSCASACSLFFSITVRHLRRSSTACTATRRATSTRSSSRSSSASCRCCSSTTSASSCRTARPRRWRTRRRTCRRPSSRARRSRRSPTASRSSGSWPCCRRARSPASRASSTRCTRRSGCTAAPANFLVKVMVVGFIFALVTSGSVWMIGSDRVQAVAAYDGAFFPWFGKFNAKLGTPVRVNVLSGVVSTVFMIAAVHLSTGSNASTFTVVLYLATSTTLLSYLLIFTAALKLRYSHPNVERPYRVPGGMAGMWAMVSLITGWMVLGSWVAIFPGTLEELFGKSYSHPGQLRRLAPPLRGVHARHARDHRADRHRRLHRRCRRAREDGRSPPARARGRGRRRLSGDGRALIPGRAAGRIGPPPGARGCGPGCVGYNVRLATHPCRPRGRLRRARRSSRAPARRAATCASGRTSRSTRRTRSRRCSRSRSTRTTLTYYDQLIGLKDKDQSIDYSKGLATGADVSKDGKTITFHLRKGIHWSDGVPFTSADALWTFNATCRTRRTSCTRRSRP